ncbi:MAG: TIGR04086 family membrane protein [Bacillota bacterium]|jgi:putative membrane protein (TIGR04086 family)
MALPDDRPARQPLNWISMGRGLLIALATAIVLSLVSTVVLYFSNFSEKFMPWIAALIVFTGVFFGAALASARAGNKGLYHGLGVGLGFFLLMWGLGMLLFPGPMTVIGLLEKLLLAGSAGALGGIVGVSFGD